MPKTVAALYVDRAHGPYIKIPGVDVWGWSCKDGPCRPGDRDAEMYDGPYPVIAHPPCGPWGMFAWRYKGGEGAMEAGLRAVEQIREFGGVLEHPVNSKLWKALDLPKPGDPPDEYGGWTLRVHQVDWGHPAQKPTWLYIVGVHPDDVPQMPPPRAATHVMVRKVSNTNELPEVPKAKRHLTPPAFAKWLVALARRVR